MTRPVFIGDELTAAGYRLAGLEILTPDPAEALSTVQTARDQNPPLILLTAETAAHLEPQTLEGLLAATRPPIQLVTDAGRRVPVPDLAERVRTEVGVSE